jgi:hypothetical protein
VDGVVALDEKIGLDDKDARSPVHWNDRPEVVEN